MAIGATELRGAPDASRHEVEAAPEPSFGKLRFSHMLEVHGSQGSPRTAY